MANTITRWFNNSGKGAEQKDRIFVTIIDKNGEQLEAWLPKNQIKILERQYGFGGAKSVKVELPVALVDSFVPSYPVKDVVDNHDGTYSYTHLGKKLRSSYATLEAMKKIKK